MDIIVNRWVFPIVAAIFVGGFFINDQASISPVGVTLITILTLIGVAVTERLDTIIRNKDKKVFLVD